MIDLRSLFAVAVCSIAAIGSARAAEVTLRMKGGDLEVTGELVSFNGLQYVVAAPALGTMSLDAARFDCQGTGCARLATAPALPPERLDPSTPGSVTVRGSNSIGSSLMPALIRGYAATLGASTTQIVGTSPGETKFRLGDAGGAELATFIVQKEGSSDALAALQKSPGTLAITDRAISDQEVAGLGDASSHMRSPGFQHVLAQDALAIVVSPENSSVSMTEDLIAKIFSGQTTDWFDAGVSGGKINVYALAPSTEVQTIFTDQLLKPRGLSVFAGIRIVETESDVADAVARDPNGIGVTSLAFLRNAKPLNIEGACGLFSKPSPFSVKAGEYRLRRRLYVYSTGTLEQPAARGLLRYAMSAASQSGIAASQFVDRAIEPLDLDEQKWRMAHAANAPAPIFDAEQMRALLADVKSAKRLSITFRYVSGTPDLDAASRENIANLASLLQGPAYAGKKILLIGFTDAAGRFQPNVGLSQKRAQQIRTALMSASGGHVNAASIDVRGYGPLAPVACNDTDEGARLNRRVEVWVRD